MTARRLAVVWPGRTHPTRSWITFLGLIFSASVTFLGFFLFNWIVAARGFVLED